MTNDAVNSLEQAFEKVRYYVQRWKIERFHYVLKNGCALEYGENEDADIDVFGDSGVYYEPHLYSAGKPLPAVHDTV